jgi:hypothetical protein
VRRSTQTKAASADREWLDAHLQDRIKRLESDLHIARTERERLRSELLMAQSWRREYALWLDEVHVATGERARRPTPETLLGPETLALLKDIAPLSAWRPVRVVIAAALLPWAIIATAAYGIWLLASVKAEATRPESPTVYTQAAGGTRPLTPAR